MAPSCLASSATLMSPSTRTMRFCALGATAAGFLASASLRLRRGEVKARGVTVTEGRPVVRLVTCRAIFSCSWRLTTSRNCLRCRPLRSGASWGARGASPLTGGLGRTTGVVSARAPTGAGASGTTGGGTSGTGTSSSGISGAGTPGSATAGSTGAVSSGTATGSVDSGCTSAGASGSTGAGSGSSSTRLRRRITAPPPFRATRASVTGPWRSFTPSFSRSSAASSSSTEAIALFSSTPMARAFSTNSVRSMPSSSAIL